MICVNALSLWSNSSQPMDIMPPNEDPFGMLLSTRMCLYTKYLFQRHFTRAHDACEPNGPDAHGR